MSAEQSNILKRIGLIILKQLELNKHRKEQREGMNNFLFKIINFIDYPFHWLRTLTLPPVNEDEYDHFYLILWPVLGIPFLAFNFTLDPWVYLFLLPVIFVSSFLFYKTPADAENPKKPPKYFLLVVIIGVFAGILWTKICCALLVDLLTFVGRLTGLSSAYLGLTVIAVGNALGDGLTTIALARKGQAVLGLTGGIAGQLLGLLLGFGISMLKKTLKEGNQVFDLFNKEKLNENVLDLIVIFFALLSLVFIFAYMTLTNFRMNRKMAFVLLAIYAAFIMTTTIIAFKQAFFDK